MPARAPHAKRILSISYNPSLLLTRQLLLEQAGFEVVSTSELSQALEACETSDSPFDLVILGHSIPPEEKRKFVAHLKHNSNAPILALLRTNESPVEGAVASVESIDVKQFMATVRQLLDSP
jgi:DNA-binding response OmpR family regulator